jgi:hypothetical protein
MEILLTVAIVVITLAVVAQTIVLVAMFLMSRNLAASVDDLMTESKRLLPPLETITANLRTASGDLAEAGKIARTQVRQVQELVTETQDTIREQICEVRDAVARPLREYSAISHAIGAGFRTFFYRRQQPAGTQTVPPDEKHQDPAA